MRLMSICWLVSESHEPDELSCMDCDWDMRTRVSWTVSTESGCVVFGFWRLVTAGRTSKRIDPSLCGFYSDRDLGLGAIIMDILPHGSHEHDIFNRHLTRFFAMKLRL
jgi:hypothetical protein